MYQRILLAVLVSVMLPHSAGSQPPPRSQARSATPSPAHPTFEARVDSVVQIDVLGQGMPSASVAVMRGDRVVLERAWGLADVASGRKAEPSTTYQIASVSKPFTAALVLKLVDRNRLSLSDPISRHLSALKPEWRGITVEQLLNHTSGLPGEFRRVDQATEPRSSDALVAMAMDDTLAAAPGTTFIYSNTGYMLLGVLIEELYGKPYGDVLRDEIARPIGLASLKYCADGNATAASYLRSAQRPPRALASFHPSQLLGNGGICSTAGDLARWNRSLHGGMVLSDASYAAMTTPRGAALEKNYGLGLYVRPAPWGSMAMIHEGTTAGYAAANVWYPAESLSVVVLYNGVPRVPQDVDGVIAEIAFGRTPTPRRAPPATAPAASGSAQATPAPPPAAIAPANASIYVGEYEVHPGLSFVISLENGVLYVTPPAVAAGAKTYLVLTSGSTFTIGSGDGATTVTFVRGANGRVTEMLTRDGGTERTARRIR